MEAFDYPKKGKNIPPSKHDAPPKEAVPEPEGDEQEDEQAAQSYYDENGERVEQEEGKDYGDEM